MPLRAGVKMTTKHRTKKHCAAISCPFLPFAVETSLTQAGLPDTQRERSAHLMALVRSLSSSLAFARLLHPGGFLRLPASLAGSGAPIGVWCGCAWICTWRSSRRRAEGHPFSFFPPSGFVSRLGFPLVPGFACWFRSCLFKLAALLEGPGPGQETGMLLFGHALG